MPTRPEAPEQSAAAGATPRNVNGRSLNRRGLATRAQVLAAAIRVLSSGEPGSVSANLVAKEAGVTWGTVRHTFGDVDGLWSATLDELMTDARIVPALETASVADRVAEIVESLWVLMDTPLTRAVESLRSTLPVDYDDLVATYPCTAASLAAWEDKWRREYELAFDGLGIDPGRIEAVSAVLPAAVRGLLVERRLSTRLDVDRARASLAAGMALYLEAPAAAPQRSGRKSR